MPRTSPLKAAAAALGLLTGFVMAPESQGPLDRDVTPYAVTVAWHVSAPPELPSVSGVQVDDWGGRLAPRPVRAAPAAPAAPSAAKNRAPARTRAAKPRPAAAPAVQTAEAPPPPVVRGSELAAATFGVPRRECAREDAHEHALHGASES